MISILSWLWNWVGSSGGAAPVIEYQVHVRRATPPRACAVVRAQHLPVALRRGTKPLLVTVTRDTD